MTASMSRGPSVPDDASALNFEVDVFPRVASVRLVFLAECPPLDFEQLARDFPAVGVGRWADCATVDQRIDAADWRAELLDFGAWDRLWASAAAEYAEVAIIGGEGLCGKAFEMLTRYQRYLPRRNEASQTEAFERVFQRHVDLHDLRKPLVKADFEHALDVWQWTLRLDPSASMALQLAALFHDIERLQSEADRRVEQFASDYQAFKDAHAKGGAGLTSALLTSLGIDPGIVSRVVELIEAHERPNSASRDSDAATLADADALSFFALNSPGFVDYYGRAHSLSKVAYSLGRMTRGARPLLQRIKLRADVRSLLDEVLARGEDSKAAMLARSP